jgi:hypothetical protein
MSCESFPLLTPRVILLSRNDAIGLGGTASLAVRRRSLPPRRPHDDQPPFSGPFVRSVVGLAARPNGLVARSTQMATAWIRLRKFRR